MGKYVQMLCERSGFLHIGSAGIAGIGAARHKGDRAGGLSPTKKERGPEERGRSTNTNPNMPGSRSFLSRPELHSLHKSVNTLASSLTPIKSECSNALDCKRLKNLSKNLFKRQNSHGEIG